MEKIPGVGVESILTEVARWTVVMKTHQYAEVITLVSSRPSTSQYRLDTSMMLKSTRWTVLRFLDSSAVDGSAA